MTQIQDIRRTWNAGDQAFESFQIPRLAALVLSYLVLNLGLAQLGVGSEFFRLELGGIADEALHLVGHLGAATLPGLLLDYLAIDLRTRTKSLFTPAGADAA